MYSVKNETYTERTVQTNDVSKFVKESLLYLSSFGLEIPLMSLKVLTVSATDQPE